MADETVEVRVETDGIAVVTLNRASKLNAISTAMRIAFRAAVERLAGDDVIGCLVLTGAGGNFSAGVDMREVSTGPDRVRYRPHPVDVVRELTKPVIAAVDGYCLTGGLELALACDFIVATDRARFGDTHARLGIVPAWGMSAYLPRAVGVRRARQLAYTAELIDARRAYEWGLVNEIVPEAELLSRAVELARAIRTTSDASDGRSLAVLRDLYARYDGSPTAAAIDGESAAVAEWLDAADRADPRAGSGRPP